MAQKPATKWVPSPNYDVGRNGQPARAICIHIAEGPMNALDNHFRSPASGVSSHYGISKKGAIHQYVNDENAAWANGLRWRSGRWYTPSVTPRPVSPAAELVQQLPGVNPNLYTISIEHEGYSGEAWTQAMVEADVKLISYLCAEYGIPPDADHIIPHAAINPVDKARCPGEGCPLEEIIAAVEARLSQSEEWLGDFRWANERLEGTPFHQGEPADGAYTTTAEIQVQAGTRGKFIWWDGEVYAKVYPDNKTP